MIEWKFGDRLVHSGRPEWGVGQVSQVEPAVQDGRPCQRVTVRFERAGVKTLSTAFADLRYADASPVAAPVPDDDPLGAALAGKPEEYMCKVPEAALDPFIPPRKRLENTLGLYRFAEGGGLLLDWAAMQSGLKDPLSRFNRHELERLYQRFLVNVDAHLKKLARELARNDPNAIRELAPKAPKAAQQALRRVDAWR